MVVMDIGPWMARYVGENEDFAKPFCAWHLNIRLYLCENVTPLHGSRVV